MNDTGVWINEEEAGKKDKHEQTNPFGNYLSDFPNVEAFLEMTFTVNASAYRHTNAYIGANII